MTLKTTIEKVLSENVKGDSTELSKQLRHRLGGRLRTVIIDAMEDTYMYDLRDTLFAAMENELGLNNVENIPDKKS